MPCISEFYGIRVYFYFNDHQPPHFHAIYGEHEAIIEIATMKVRRGGLPARATGLVFEWARLRQADLMRAWRQAAEPSRIDPIEPLP